MREYVIRIRPYDENRLDIEVLKNGELVENGIPPYALLPGLQRAMEDIVTDFEKDPL